MKDIEEMRKMAKEDPSVLEEARQEMMTDGKLQETAQVSAIQRVLVKAGLCTVEDLNKHAEEAKPFIVDLTMAIFESDEAVIKAAERYWRWLETGQ